PKNKKNGRCAVYSLRPLICRLFGFFAAKDKMGKPVYGGCKIIKKKYPQAFLRAGQMIASRSQLLKMSDISARIYGVGASSDEKIFPINIAARRALEKVGFIVEKKQ
ncbi:MAG: YkgJ family cysteine cluster protein, partial [Candidatus Omnitrophica bacterium]|nr:YkgJ family cysteine cluster protein [Candidatus Omnitrophota bacterium]